METKTITSTAVWYHISSASGDSASKWAKGAARKGVYNGKANLSTVIYNLDDIAEAIGGDPLIGADLVLTRDVAYGTDAITVSVAPALIRDISDETYMSRSQCIEMAMRQLHKSILIEGDTATFRLPGAMLREIQAGNVNAFVLYQETDGTEGYCRLADSATLNLYTGSGYKDPVWTRAVSEGDVICSDIYSHIADLRELEFYINMRRREISLSDMTDIGTVTYGQQDKIALGEYAGWPAIITALQTGAAGFAPDTEWTAPVEGAFPKADIIRELRTIIGGDDRQRIKSRTIIHAVQGSIKESIRYDTAKPMTWYGYGTSAGKTKTTVMVDGRASTTWLMNVCGWIFDTTGMGAFTTAALELTIKETEKAKVRIALYGLKVTEVPDTDTSYSSVFDAAAIGDGEGTAGETVKISINAEGITKLNTGVIHGIGVRYDNDYAVFDMEAALMVT